MAATAILADQQSAALRGLGRLALGLGGLRAVLLGLVLALLGPS